MRLAREGASVIGIDIAADVSFYRTCPGPTEQDLKEIARRVEAEGRRCLMAVADGVAKLGGRLVVVANAGISTWARFWEMPDDEWQTMIDVNLTGIWRTMKASVPHMISAPAAMNQAELPASVISLFGRQAN